LPLKTIKSERVNVMNVYEIVTGKIIALLEQGEIPWRKPWKSKGMPLNLVSKRPYRGVNVFLLASTRYSSKYWLTYDQALDLGGHVKKGEKASLIFFWKVLQKVEEDQDGNEKTEKIPLLRYYNVFNLEQCDGIKTPADELPVDEFTPIEKAEQIVEGMPNRPEIRHEGTQACYSPILDYIKMPKHDLFISPEEYYSTLFHEMVHSTGHSSRVNRKLNDRITPFGSSDYSKEELIAEMGASFSCGICEIENSTLENSAAYIRSWLKVLRGDSKLVVMAAAAASKAADYILKIKHEEQEPNPALIF
jgi:antirestriction protein ArdC